MSVQPAVARTPPGSPRASVDDEAAVDIAFDLVADALPLDHRAALCDAVSRRLPSLRDDPVVGIHALAATAAVAVALLPSRRTRLVLRVPASRADEALALAGSVLDVGGHRVRVGAPHVKRLQPFATIGAAFVVTMATDALAHQRAVETMLDALDAPRRFICGRMSSLRTGDIEVAGGSVVMHGLSPADSLRVQRLGLGAHRRLGCGLFVPHKTISGLD